MVEIKACPVCNTEMHIVTYTKNVKSVWSGQEIIVCKRCKYAEDNHGNRVPTL